MFVYKNDCIGASHFVHSQGEVKVEKIIVDINAKWEQAKQCDISKTIARAEQEGNQGRLVSVSNRK